MDGKKTLARRFEANRAHLRSVALRMLGSSGEAEDAVQEAWLRLDRAEAAEIGNLGGWLTTVVARICLDMLRARRSRREEPLGSDDGEPEELPSTATHAGDPEAETVLADSVGGALLVVLETLMPAERLAFVLHDMFAVPFDEIGPIVDRTPEAARQLASRARRRVRGRPVALESEWSHRRRLVDAFLAASRGGDFDALLAVLDPDVVMRADAAAARLGGTAELRGAAAVASAFVGKAQAARPAMVDGRPGLAVLPAGQLLVVLSFTIADGRIVAMEAIAEPERLCGIDLAVLSE